MTNLMTQPDPTINGVTNWVDYWQYGSVYWYQNQPTPGATTASGSYYRGTFDVRSGIFKWLYLNTNQISVTAGTVYTVGMTTGTRNGISTNPWVHVRWLNSSGAYLSEFNGSSVTNGYVPNNTTRSFQVTAPAGAVKAQIGVAVETDTNPNAGYIEFTNLYFGTYTSTGSGGTTPPPGGTTNPPGAGLDYRLEIEDTSSPGNLIDNPSGETGASGWVSNVGSALVTTSGSGTWTFLKMVAKSQVATQYVSDAFPVTTAKQYLGLRLLWGGFSADSRIGIRVEWLDINKAVLGSTGEEVVTPVSGAEYNKVVGGYSTGTQYARLRFDQYHYAGTNDNPWVNDFFEFREATAIQGNTLAEVENLESWQAESIVWVDVIEPTHEISIERDSVDVGLLSATVLDEQYDPANGGLIRPGAAVRVSVNTGTTYKNIFQGTINNVRTEYPRKGSARISLSASDAMTLLSNQKEPKGVATIALLPNILADKGVKWSANGNANQVGSAAQVSSNDSASVFDQIVITRDSDKGYAWVDANNVLQLWNRASMPTAPVVTFSDASGASASYSDIDTGFDTARTINVVEITYLRYYQNADLEWVTDEIKYGPYINADSLKAWGAYKSTFTIHGITESAANMQTFANEVLAKNATPTVKVNRITVPVRNAAERANAANIDLYSMVHVTYNTRFSGDLRVTGISHEITPERWVTEYTFEKGDSVAVPVWTPSVNA